MTTIAAWPGASGREYRFTVHPISDRPASRRVGNYIFAKQSSFGTWFAVYIGQGNLQERYDVALREGCVTDKGATHFHSHQNDDERSRRNEETDLIGGNSECWWPSGCNGHD